MNDPAATRRVSTGYNILFFYCHSGRDPESREPLLDSCFRRNDVMRKPCSKLQGMLKFNSLEMFLMR